MTTNGSIRASDQDREHVVEVLRTHYSEGRLTLEEFDERVSAAYAGKTWGDLLDLTSDLPVHVELGADRVPAAADAREPARGRGGWPGLAFASLVPLALAVALISFFAVAGTGHGPGHHHYVPFFPVWPLLVIALVFLRRGLRWGRGGGRR